MKSLLCLNSFSDFPLLPGHSLSSLSWRPGLPPSGLVILPSLPRCPPSCLHSSHMSFVFSRLCSVFSLLQALTSRYLHMAFPSPGILFSHPLLLCSCNSPLSLLIHHTCNYLFNIHVRSVLLGTTSVLFTPSLSPPIASTISRM